MHTAKLWCLPVIFLALLVSACVATPTPVPTLTDTPQPTVTHTLLPTSTPQVRVTPTLEATLAPVGGYKVRAWVALEEPGSDSAQTVFAELTKDKEVVAGAQMYVMVHYGTVDQRWPQGDFVTTGDDGIAAVSFVIPYTGAERGTVPVDVYIVHGGEALSGSTSFTLRC